MTEPNDEPLPSGDGMEIESRVYQERYNDQMFLGLALPVDFFEKLQLKNNDIIKWIRVDDDNYQLKIVR